VLDDIVIAGLGLKVKVVGLVKVRIAFHKEIHRHGLLSKISDQWCTIDTAHDFSIVSDAGITGVRPAEADTNTRELWIQLKIFRTLMAGRACSVRVRPGVGGAHGHPRTVTDFAALSILHPGGAAHSQSVIVARCKRRLGQIGDRSLRRPRRSRYKFEERSSV